MNISATTGITSASGMISGGCGMDEEEKRIIERMLALGLTPTGNKSSDRAKLHEVEIRLMKTELGTKGEGSVDAGKYVTISATEIAQLKEKLQEKSKEENTPEMKEMREATENRTGAEQQALINKYLLKLQQSVV